MTEITALSLAETSREEIARQAWAGELSQNAIDHIFELADEARKNDPAEAERLAGLAWAANDGATSAKWEARHDIPDTATLIEWALNRTDYAWQLALEYDHRLASNLFVAYRQLAARTTDKALQAHCFHASELCQDIANEPQPEPEQEPGPDDEPPEWTAEDIDHEPEPEPMSAAPRFSLLSPDDLAALPPLRWRVRGVLPTEGLAALYGPPGSGKSFLALDLLASISESRAWFGHTVTPCACVYVGLEGEAGVAQRVQAYLARHGTPGGLRVVLNGLDIRRADDREELAQTIRAAGMDGGLLCVDTLNRSAPGLDENDAREMGLIIEAMKALQGELGGLVLVVHHAGKDVTRGLRGHSSLLAALDAVVEVTRDGERRAWSLAKSKDGEDGNAHPFRLDVVELPPDADGWPVSSCVIQQEEPAADAVRRVKTPKGGNQRIIWDGLGELLRDSQTFGLGEAPPTRPCILLEDAINHLRTRLAVPPERQTERTRGAITGLVSSGLINLRDGWLWCA